MSQNKKSTINVQGTAVTILSQREDDFISLTDIARHRDSERTDYIIQNWLRNRSTIEYLGLWEQLNNPGFKPIEFDGFRFQVGIQNVSSPAAVAELGSESHSSANSHPYRAEPHPEWRTSDPNSAGYR